MSDTKNKEQILKPGAYVGNYVVIRLIGRGAMGEVYLARQRFLGGNYALKLLFPDVESRNPQGVQRFIREAQLACRIKDHSNLIKVYDVGNENGLYYIVMDYIDGGSLRDLLKKEHRLQPKKALNIVLQLSKALQAAYENQMVHRDIKPDNIMFTSDGTVKLADLGIAKSLDEQDTELTVNVSVFGTPAYMSPEQAKDASKVDCRADIYSLGIVLYEMLLGERPYMDKNQMQILSKLISKEEIPDVHEQDSSILPVISRLVADMTRKKVNERIATPMELEQRIIEARQALGGGAPVTIRGGAGSGMRAQHQRGLHVPGNITLPKTMPPLQSKEEEPPAKEAVPAMQHPVEKAPGNAATPTPNAESKETRHETRKGTSQTPKLVLPKQRQEGRDMVLGRLGGRTGLSQKTPDTKSPAISVRALDIRQNASQAQSPDSSAAAAPEVAKVETPVAPEVPNDKAPKPFIRTIMMEKMPSASCARMSNDKPFSPYLETAAMDEDKPSSPSGASATEEKPYVGTAATEEKPYVESAATEEKPVKTEATVERESAAGAGAPAWQGQGTQLQQGAEAAKTPRLQKTIDGTTPRLQTLHGVKSPTAPPYPVQTKALEEPSSKIGIRIDLQNKGDKASEGKKGSLGRSLFLGCLTFVLLMVLMAGGGYYAYMRIRPRPLPPEPDKLAPETSTATQPAQDSPEPSEPQVSSKESAKFKESLEDVKKNGNELIRRLGELAGNLYSFKGKFLGEGKELTDALSERDRLLKDVKDFNERFSKLKTKMENISEELQKYSSYDCAAGYQKWEKEFKNNTQMDLTKPIANIDKALKMAYSELLESAKDDRKKIEDDSEDITNSIDQERFDEIIQEMEDKAADIAKKLEQRAAFLETNLESSEPLQLAASDEDKEELKKYVDDLNNEIPRMRTLWESVHTNIVEKIKELDRLRRPVRIDECRKAYETMMEKGFPHIGGGAFTRLKDVRDRLVDNCEDQWRRSLDKTKEFVSTLRTLRIDGPAGAKVTLSSDDVDFVSGEIPNTGVLFCEKLRLGEYTLNASPSAEQGRQNKKIVPSSKEVIIVKEVEKPKEVLKLEDIRYALTVKSEPGANIVLTGADGEKQERKVGTDGQCVFSELLPGKYKVKAMLKDYRPEMKTQEIHRKDETVQLKLEEIRNTLTVKGKPKASVVLKSNDGRVIDTSYVKANGQCIFSNLKPGLYIVEATLEHYRIDPHKVPIDDKNKEISLDEKEILSKLTIKSEPGASVELKSKDGKFYLDKVKWNGVFEETLRPGKYHVNISLTGYEQHSEELEIGDEPLRVQRLLNKEKQPRREEVRPLPPVSGTPERQQQPRREEVRPLQPVATRPARPAAADNTRIADEGREYILTIKCMISSDSHGIDDITKAKEAEVRVEVEKFNGNRFTYYTAKVSDSNGECRFSLPRGVYRVKGTNKKKYSEQKELEVLKDMEQTINILSDGDRKPRNKLQLRLRY